MTDRSRALPDQGERVWTMPESRVYHTTPDCRALKRANRYYAPSRVPISEATGPRAYSGRRRPCALCAASDQERRDG